MNRLILIGNGFDLAHGMKTGYNDFILWYITNCFSFAKLEKPYEDELIRIRVNENPYLQDELGKLSVEDYVLRHYQNGTLASKMGLDDNAYPIFLPINHYDSYDPNWTSGFDVWVKSDLLKALVSDCRIDRWVDIENLFYEALKKALDDNNQNKAEEVKKLNQSMTFLIKELSVYLSNLGQCTDNDDAYRLIIKEPIQPDEIVFRAPLSEKLEKNIPRNTLILNFNYTNTVEQYLRDDKEININYIHGKLKRPDNPMIFGFGDELDDAYQRFELDKTKEIYKYIKSFWYFKTSNYQNLLRFIQGEPFQVYILGHSCGLSDRTMLNMIFEHENCISIKIFYYRNPESGYNNYTDLTEEISRHFKDKRQMRLKIVPLDKSSEMPQILPF